MKKSFRTAAVITMVAMMAAGAASAATPRKGGDSRPGFGDARQGHGDARPGHGAANGGRHQPNGMAAPGMMPGMMMPMPGDRTVIIGQVKEVDKKSGRLVLTNTDGKEVEVTTSPFTLVMFEPGAKHMKPRHDRRGPRRHDAQADSQEAAQVAEAQDDGDVPEPPAPPKGRKFGDIKAGAWVIVTPFKTDTKYPSAQTIFVKKGAK